MYTPAQWKQDEKRAFSVFFSNLKKCEKSLDYAIVYCDKYDSLLQNMWNSINPPKQVALCVFGSPSRYEMLGESDLDCILIREDSVNISRYRERFIEKLNEYGFSKIDIPEWGTLTDCKNYLKSAITEGNQVIEARKIFGDDATWEKVQQLRDTYCNRERSRITFLFQYLYFNQYYKQRERENQNNLKYGHGGTRDFLFPVWLANLREGHAYIQSRKSPSVILGLESLLNKGNISESQFEQMKAAVNKIAFIRNELLRQSQGTIDSGLTYLGDETAQKISESLPHIYHNKNSVIQEGLDGIKIIQLIKNICYNVFMMEEDVKKRIGPGVRLDPFEELSATVLSWKSNLDEIDVKLLQKISDTKSWAVLTSLACNPTCSSDLLQSLAEKGTEQGYEYVAKVIGRNPQTTPETLSYIARSSIEDRFKEPAKVRLEKGWKKANELQ